MAKRIISSKWCGIIIPAILILVWQIASATGILNASVLPSPVKLLETTKEIIADGSFGKNIVVSLRRVFLGYLLGASLGIMLGIIIGLSRTADSFLTPFLEIMRPIPILAWVPILILWAGLGEKSKIITIAIGSFWSVLLNTTDGVRNVDRKYTEVAELFMKRKTDKIFLVMLPAAVPSIFTGLRVGIASAWLSVIGAEMVAASSGLGYFITYNREMMRPAKMYVGVITIGLIGWLINVFIRKLEKFLLRWNTNRKE